MKLSFRQLFLFCAICLLPVLSPVNAQDSDAEKPIEFSEHPRVMFDADGLQSLKKRVGTGWAKPIWKNQLKRADAAVDRKVDVPARGGNWWHWYNCPDHGSVLKRGKKIGDWEWEHECTTDGKVWKGEPDNPKKDFDGVAIMSTHQENAHDIRYLGLAYAVTGKKAYAKTCRELLLAYAEVYPDYAYHTRKGGWSNFKRGGGKVSSQSLDEAVWLIPVAQGADLIWDQLSEEDRLTLEENLFLPAVKDVILPHHKEIHNIQNWKNSAVATVGFLLGDRELVDAAIHDPDEGFHAQLKEGIIGDGIWWEGAWSYHFYTLDAMWPLMEAARHNGLDLYGDLHKSMYDAPVNFVMPNASLPRFNDSDAVGSDLKHKIRLYELAYARYGDGRYLPIIAEANRTSELALWFGESELPKAKEWSWTSTNHEDAGYAVLAREQKGGPIWTILKYGPHGGGHGHPDKLGFVLCHGESLVAADPGTTRYGSPLHEGWYKRTVAHNTLVIDERDQREATGKLIDFGSVKGIDYVMAEAGEIASGVRYIRTLALIDPSIVLVVDQVKADSSHTFDIVYHQRGSWLGLPDGQPWEPPGSSGYQYLKSAREHSFPKGFALQTKLDDRTIGIYMSDTQDARIMTATGIGDDESDRVPTVFFRKEGAEAAWVWCISLDGVPVQLIPGDALDEDGAPYGRETVVAVQVRPKKGKPVTLVINPNRKAVEARIKGKKLSGSDAFLVK